ncbi:P-loop containing nucleoside triphosphate hydrolase protein [Pavlovales sp. CCMP2436]|nr:P-loop containing nucleoside triphosphate hydrolase protein [Pavlovales sp. CCMP2436]
MRAAPLPAVPSVRDVVAGAGVFGSAPSSFRDLPIEPKLASHIEEHLQLPKPTLIQARAVPAILSGKDALVRAETGSGKTIAYLLPIVQRLINSSREQKFTREQGTLALVLTPTRELSFQTLEACEALTRPLPWIVCGAVLGGESRKSEKARLRKGVTVLVATPGRLDDHIQHTERLRVDYLQAIVLDEADRKVLPPPLIFILDIVLLTSPDLQPEGGQNTFCFVFYNTSFNVPRLAARRRTRKLIVVMVAVETNRVIARVAGADGEEDEDEVPTRIILHTGEEQLSAPKQLKQHFVLVPAKLRLVTLTTLLASSLRHGEATGAKAKVRTPYFHLVLLVGIQAGAKASAKPGDEPAGGGFKAGGLTRSGVYALHGSMAQSERTSVWRGFCAAKSGVLIATDVVARGLNLDGVAQIIQFDLPADPMEYVHRIGRTARIGKAGSALLFVLPSEAGFLELLKSRGLELSSSSIISIVTTLFIFIIIFNTIIIYMIQSVSSDKELHDLAGRAFQSFLCAYAAHPKATKSLLRLKDLHLGHIAKGFGM